MTTLWAISPRSDVDVRGSTANALLVTVASALAMAARAGDMRLGDGALKGA